MILLSDSLPLMIYLPGCSELQVNILLFRMSEIWDAIKDRKLKHITMPGSHDSGMSRIEEPSDWGM